MRKLATGYPHPVLGCGDDIAGNFNAELEARVEGHMFELSVEYTLDNESIRAHVNSGTAAFALVVTCRQTFERRTVIAKSSTLKKALPAKDYRGMVELEPCVLALKEIREYVPVGLNREFGAATFRVLPGDALALDAPIRTFLDPGFDPLRAPITSIMRITGGSRASGPMLVGYDDDQILIELSSTSWGNYKLAKLASAPEFLHAAIVLPVLVEAVTKARNPDDDNQHCRWHGRLLEILNAQGIGTSETPLFAAQQILADPTSRALSGFMTFQEDESDG